MKSMTRTILCLFAAAAVIVSGSPARCADKPITLRIGHVVTEDGGEHLGSLKLAELLNKKSNGMIKLQIFPNGQVGQNREMVESLQGGALDMALPALPGLGGFTQSTRIFDLFYLFNDRKEAEKVLDGPVGRDVAKAVESAGIKIISWWSQGFRESTSNRLFKTPAELRGLKIRVMENPLHIEAWNTLGASAIPMAFSEVLTSLQQGVLDAQENPYQNIVNSGFDTVQKYVIETGHLYGPLPLVYSKINWDKLTPEQQKIIQEAADETKIWQREKQEEINSNLKQAILKKGKTKIIELSAAEKEEFRKKLAPLYKKHAPQMSGYVEKIYQQLGRQVAF
ncbi:MAG: TRAP transporter substrate-binding protein [Desulfovibrio sp.]|jgi:tripartite ATP-independent transporter DctP family solute receptor|nr:TRAP transporter substrate-binding protein [Desulfovibrio sp.]